MSLLWYSFAVLLFLSLVLFIALAAGDLRMRRFRERRDWFIRRTDQANALVTRLRDNFTLTLPTEEELEELEREKFSIEDEVDPETEAHKKLLEMINNAARQSPVEFGAAIRQTIQTDLDQRSRLSVFAIEEEEREAAEQAELEARKAALAKRTATAVAS